MVNLAKLDDSAVKFTFTDSQHYLTGNGEITVPLNSLILVLDESNMATFKKVDGDPFISFLISESNFSSKADLEAFYKENMVGGGVDPEEVVDIVESATSYYDGVEYDSVNSRINFKHNNVVEGYVDAAPFIVDGMVSDVAIVNGNLVITFNTDSGKQPISIPLTDIFDPSNYYDKTAIDTIISGVNDSIIEDEEVISSALNDLNERKLDASAYTPTDLSNYDTKAEVNTKISTATGLVNGALTAHTSDTTVHVTAAEKSTWNDKLTDVNTGTASYAGSGVTDIKISKNGSSYTTRTFVASINNKPILAGSDYTNVNKFSLVETSAITTSVTSASTDTEIPSAKAVYDALGQGGGGKAVSGGTNISITTGETADTINCTLPIVMNKSNMRINSGNREFANSLSNCFTFGGFNTVGNGNSCGYLVTFGSDNDMSTSSNNRRYRYAFGTFLKTQNSGEIAFSKYNVSSSASETFGDSGNTLFSVGNGTANNARHNAFEIRQNGDIYITKDGADVKLQDQLGGGSASSAITSGDTNAVQGGAVYDKFDEVEQVTAAALNNLNNKFGGLSLVKLTQAEYDALTTKDNNVLYVIVD